MEYVLAWKDECAAEHDTVINEVDIDNFIRAKAAIKDHYVASIFLPHTDSSLFPKAEQRKGQRTSRATT